MHGYLSADNICSEKRTVFWEGSSRTTVSFEEQLTSKDKFARPNEGYACLLSFKYFSQRLKFCIFHSFSWEILGHVTCLNQSRARENIWWIIIGSMNVSLIYRLYDWLWSSGVRLYFRICTLRYWDVPLSKLGHLAKHFQYHPRPLTLLILSLSIPIISSMKS